MFLKRLGVQVDDIARALAERHHVDAASQGLQVRIRADLGAKAIHHVESGFAAVEEQTLEPGAATGFEMGDTGFHGGLYRRQKVIGKYASAEHGLKTVSERGVHELNDFLGHCVLLVYFWSCIRLLAKCSAS